MSVFFGEISFVSSLIFFRSRLCFSASTSASNFCVSTSSSSCSALRLFSAFLASLRSFKILCALFAPLIALEILLALRERPKNAPKIAPPMFSAASTPRLNTSPFSFSYFSLAREILSSRRAFSFSNLAVISSVLASRASFALSLRRTKNSSLLSPGFESRSSALKSSNFSLR